jgi:hypothetical protein
MRCITLTQPYATLIALGAKKIETRSWATRYRGPLAIHAAKGYPTWARDLAARDPFYGVLRASMPPLETTGEPPVLPGLLLPRGAIVAVCELVDCRPTNEIHDHFLAWNKGRLYWDLTDQERVFGDYAPDRYAWLLSDIRALPTPIPAKGALSLWEYEGDL